MCSLFPEDLPWSSTYLSFSPRPAARWGSRPLHASWEIFSFELKEVASWLGRRLVPVGDMWDFPRRQTGCIRRPKGMFCGFRCVGRRNAGSGVWGAGRRRPGMRWTSRALRTGEPGLWPTGSGTSPPRGSSVSRDLYRGSPISWDLSRAWGAHRETMRNSCDPPPWLSTRSPPLTCCQANTPPDASSRLQTWVAVQSSQALYTPV